MYSLAIIWDSSLKRAESMCNNSVLRMLQRLFREFHYKTGRREYVQCKELDERAVGCVL